MKKIIAITAMAAMVAAAAMADEPTADEMSIAVSGSEELTWGVDLDEGDTGFKNEAKAKVEVTFAKAGTKSTEGEGVWAEIGVKVDGDLKYKSEADATGAFDGGKVKVDTAKLHIGDLYIGLASGDIKVGEFKAPNAVKAEGLSVANVGGDESQGLVVGYGTDDFGIDVDFRSHKGTNDLGDANDYYDNHYGVAAEAQLKESNAFVPGLFAKVGVGYAFGGDHDNYDEAKVLGLGVSAGYKLSLGDTFYLKPAVGVSGSKTGDGDFNMDLAGGVVFAWGDQGDGANTDYIGDEGKKRTPGVGVAFKMPLYDDIAGGKTIQIVPSFYSGDIVEGLKAAVIGQINLGVGYPVDTDPEFGVAAGVSYELPVGDAIKVTPHAGFRFANTNAGAGLLDVFTKSNGDNGAYNDIADAEGDPGLLNVKAGVDISGLIENTTFSACYQSRNLRAPKAAGKAGTFNVSVKVSL